MQTDEVLLEREREMLNISAALEAAARGAGSILAIEAKAGMGKTRLLAEARKRAVEVGLAVLSARATELERDFPFAVVRQLLGPQLVLLPADDRQALFEGAEAARGALGIDDDRSPDTFSVLHALYWVLAALAEQNPLLLMVDDAHLADPGSLDWLAFMLPRLEELPVVLLLASRTEEANNPGLTRIVGDTSIDHLSPAPLSAGATERLIEGALGRELEPSFAATCSEVTGGNPFLVTELARELASQAIAPQAEAVDSIRALAPDRVSQTVLARLSRLTPRAAALARSLAALGDGSEASLVAELAGLEPDAGRRSADELRRAAILDPGESLRFIHPLVRNAVYSDLAAGERAETHAVAAELLRRHGASPERIATQLLVSEPQGNRSAVETLLSASTRSLADGAPRSSVAYLTRALREPPPADLRLEILGELLFAGIRAADHDALDAAEPAMRTAMNSDPTATPRWAFPLTMSMVLRGQFEEAAEVLQTAIQIAVEDDDMETAFKLEAQLRTIAVLVPTLPEVDLDRYLGRVESNSPAGRLAAAIEARAAVVNGSAEEAIEAAKRALGNDCKIFEEEPEMASATTVVLILLVADELDAARHAAERAVAIAREPAATPDLARGCFLRGLASWGYGDLLAAEADLQQAMSLARLGGIVPLVLLCAAPIAEIFIERDELDKAESALADVGVTNEPVPQNGLFSMILFIRGVLHFERGDFPEAVDDFLALSDHAENLGFGPGPTLMGSPFAARALVAIGRPDDARRLADSALAYGRRWGAPATISHVLRAGAAARGGTEEIALLEDAVRVLEDSPRQLQRVHTLVDLGGALRRGNRRADARAPLREALAVARRCGAVRMAKRAHAELQACGETVRRYAPIGVESLTPSERRVAEMAGSGMTNRQIAQSLFVTIKTVEAHLSAAYDKLDISSRQELRGALQDGV